MLGRQCIVCKAQSDRTEQMIPVEAEDIPLVKQIAQVPRRVLHRTERHADQHQTPAGRSADRPRPRSTSAHRRRSRRRPSLPALERASVAGTGQSWRHPCRGAVGGFQVGSAGFQTGQSIGEIIGRGGVSNRLGNQPAGDQINRGSTRFAGPRGKTLSDLLKHQSG